VVLCRIFINEERCVIDRFRNFYCNEKDGSDDLLGKMFFKTTFQNLIIQYQKKKALSATRKGFPTKKHEKILLTNLDVSS
jgi:hypothetical protein